MPSATRNAALASAIRPGTRITVRESRYQKPSVVGPGVALGAAAQEAGESELTRSPSSASTAGSTVSEIAAAASATSVPPIPIERRKFCGKTRQRRERRGDRQRGVEDRAAGGGHRAPQRRQARAGARELLAVARDDEQAVVDRQAEAEPGRPG